MSAAEPYGYFKDENGIKQPIPEQLEALKQAIFYIKSGCTIQATKDWLVKKTGRPISNPGLLKIVQHSE